MWMRVKNRVASGRLIQVQMLARCHTRIPRVITRAGVKLTAVPTCGQCRIRGHPQMGPPAEALHMETMAVEHPPALAAADRQAADPPAESAWVVAEDALLVLPPDLSAASVVA